MEDDVIDIIHRISFDIEDDKLAKLTEQLRKQTEYIYQLGSRQAKLSSTFAKTSVDETDRRKKIIGLMERNKTLLDSQSKATLNLVTSNKQFNDQLVKEQGLIGATTSKLKILENARKSANSNFEKNRYSFLIETERQKLQRLQPSAPTPGLPNVLSQGTNKISGILGVASRYLPALGGAISIGALGSQMVEVTKKFESYITTLKSAYGSSVKAQGAFNKIQQFAAKTPFSVDELTSSFIKLKNRGFDPTTKELTNLGDLASSQGKSFDQLTEALLDAQTGEFERLKEFGIKAKTVGDTVTLSFKGVEKQVKKTDQEGLRNAIISLGEMTGVAGQMAAQSQTLNGKLSNLGDTTDMLLYSFSKKLGVDSFLGGLVEMANDALSALADLLDNSKELAIQSRADAIAAKTLADEYDNLAGKTKLTADEKDRLTIIQGRLVSILGESILVLNKETGAYELNMKAVRNLIREKLILANSKAVEVLTKYNEGSANRDQNIAKAKTYSAELQALARQDAQAYRDAIEASELFQKNPDQFNFYYNRLGKTAQRIFDLRGELRKANGETFKLNKNLNEIAGDYSDVTGGGAISSYFTGQLDLGDPKVKTPTKPGADKKKKKGKTAQEIALENIANAEKLAQAAEEKRNAEFLKRQNVAYQKEEISKAVFDNRIERNEEAHQKVLLEINIKYSRQRSKFQKSGDAAQSEAGAQSSEAKLKEIITKAKEKAEAEIKAAVDSFNVFNNELLSASDQTFALEMAQLEEHHKSRLKKIEDDRKKENETLLVAKENGNTELIAQSKRNIAKLNEVEAAIIAKNANEKVETEIKNALDGSAKKTVAQIQALNSFSEIERAEFEKQYGNKRDQINAELELLKSKHISDEEIEKAGGRKKEKLAKEQSEQENKIALKREIAELYIRRQGLEDELDILKIEGQKLTGQAKINNDNEVKVKKQALDENARQIRSASKKETEEKKDKDKFTIEDAAQLADATIQAAQTVISAFEANADREIEIRQRRVERATEIADRGNAEALQLEEKRLDQAQKQKEKYAKQQMALNLLQQVSALSLAIAQAAAVPFPANIGAIAAVITAVGSGIATVMQMSQDSMPAFKDGVIDFQGKGTGTSDSNVVRISRGESIIKADATAKNAEILKMINSGAEILPINYNIANGIKAGGQSQEFKIDSLEKGLQEVKDAILSKPNQSVEIDRNGIAVITEEVKITSRKRWNA